MQLLLLASGLKELAFDAQSRREAASSLLDACLAWLLARLAWATDLLLSFQWYRRLLLYTYRRQHSEALAAALQAPLPAQSFDQLEYYVDGQVRQLSVCALRVPAAAPAGTAGRAACRHASAPVCPCLAQARQLLQFAALHALSAHLQADEALAPAALLPQVSRALLQTEEPKPGRMLEAVAAALAGGMEAGLLLVDAMLLASLASATFGSSPESYLAAFTSAAPLPSRTAARLEMAWLALRGALFQLQRPTGGRSSAGGGWKQMRCVRACRRRHAAERFNSRAPHTRWRSGLPPERGAAAVRHLGGPRRLPGRLWLAGDAVAGGSRARGPPGTAGRCERGRVGGRAGGRAPSAPDAAGLQRRRRGGRGGRRRPADQG